MVSEGKVAGVMSEASKTSSVQVIREALEQAAMHGKNHDVRLASEGLLRENAALALTALDALEEQFEARGRAVARLAAFVHNDQRIGCLTYTPGVEDDACGNCDGCFAWAIAEEGVESALAAWSNYVDTNPAEGPE